MNLNGTITTITEKQTGAKRDGSGDWVKQTFVIDTKEKYNNLIAFEVFGDEKVENLTKYNKVGDEVNVEFNISCNEWQGKYFTTLNAWKIEKGTGIQQAPAPQTSSFDTVAQDDDLPF